MPEENTMQNGSQQLPEGFIVRTKEGKLMVVRNGRLVDVHASSTPPSPISVKREPLTPPPAPVERPQSRLDHVAPAPMPKPVTTSTPASAQPATPPTTGMLAPSRPLSTSSTPAYMIDAQDELDIAEHKEKVVELGDGLPLPDLDEIIRGIIAHHQLTFAEEVMEKRFMSIIRSRLSELRNSMETEEVLERPQKIGGMGFESGLIRRLMVDVEEAASTIASKGRIADLQKSMSRPRPTGDVTPYAPKIPITPPHPSMVIPERPAPPAPPPTKPLTTPSPAAVSELYTPTVPSPRTPPIRPVQVTGDGAHDTGTDVTSRITMVPPTMPTPLVAPAPMPPSSPAPIPIRRPESQMIQRPVQKTRTTVSDIVQAPTKKTLGPVDELAELTLIDFRRFGSTAAQCKEKVLEKLELLEEESFAMRSAGVKAWRRSPVFQQYLAIGRESIETGSSIQDIIARHSQSDAEVMTYEEFEAVSDLNRSLRY